jgi:transposase
VVRDWTASERMAVIMHRIWVEGTEFRWTKETAAA